jgi:hypothetical protein
MEWAIESTEVGIAGVGIGEGGSADGSGVKARGTTPVSIRYRRILRTCWGLVMTARTHILALQRAQLNGLISSYTFASRCPPCSSALPNT